MLIQKIFQIEEETILLLSTVFRIGILIAAIGVLWKDIVNIFKRPFSKLPMYIIVASIPYIVVTLLMGDYINSVLITGSILGFGFIITGIVLLIAETVESGHRDIESMTIKNPLIIGVIQGFSVFPIISRSAMAIAGALTQDLDRRFAARFSFLMAIPAILFSIILERKNLILAIHTPELIAPIIAGTIAATIAGCFAINSVSRLIARGNLNKIAYYVILLGSFILVDKFYLHLVF